MHYQVPGAVQTNNRAEYLAALCALRAADAADPAGGRPLTIYTDSQLLIRRDDNDFKMIVV